MKRFRVFAGPNGSGKSTVIDDVKAASINGQNIDFGIYINADEIARDLRQGAFSFRKYQLLNVSNLEFQNEVLLSGLINERFSFYDFSNSYQLENDLVQLLDLDLSEVIAQILSNYLVKKLLRLGNKCTLETVFSHHSKIEIMHLALSEGYKIYLYFIATEDPSINVNRVEHRVNLGGHNVPQGKIIKRYYNSLELLFDAAQLSYQCYFFDNSAFAYKLVAHFKIENGKKVWDAKYNVDLPNWFLKYYISKQ